MKVSVLIPCFNEERDLKKCLSSLMGQSISEFEIIVIDDGSTDNSKNVAISFGVILLEQDHKGPGAARNFGARIAKGDILVFLDADMYADRNFLKYLTLPIINDEAIGTFTTEEYVGNQNKFWAVCWNLEHAGSPVRRIRKDHPDESTVFRAIRRTKFLDIGGYDDLGYGEDVSLFVKLGVKAINVPQAICYHNNPETMREVFLSARYYGRGEKFYNHPIKLIKYSFPLSLIFALINTINYQNYYYFIFKLVHDFGVFWGGLSRRLLGKYLK